MFKIFVFDFCKIHPDNLNGAYWAIYCFIIK